MTGDGNSGYIDKELKFLKISFNDFNGLHFFANRSNLHFKHEPLARETGQPLLMLSTLNKIVLYCIVIVVSNTLVPAVTI